MRRLVDLVDGLALRSVEERVAAYLWSAFVRSGLTTLKGATLRLEEPKHVVASLCGTAPEVLSRTFRRSSATAWYGSRDRSRAARPRGPGHARRRVTAEARLTHQRLDLDLRPRNTSRVHGRERQL